MPIQDLPEFVRDNYEIYEWRHATAILAADFPTEWNDIQSMLMNFRLYQEWIAEAGGRKSKLAGWIDEYLGARGWKETKFDTQI